MKLCSILTFALLTFALLVAACGDDKLDGGSNDTGRHSCDNRAIESTCADFPPGTTEADAKSSCDGNVVMDLCTATGAVGVCSVQVATGTLTNTYYGDGPKPWTAATARDACGANSTFRP